jgi:hypothetical protein
VSDVQLEVRRGKARPLLYTLTETGFVIGSVPGCDLRLPGSDLPPLLGLIINGTGGLGIRKLVATAPLLVNGQSTSSAHLADGDRIQLGPVELVIHVPGLSAKCPDTVNQPVSVIRAQREPGEAVQGDDGKSSEAIRKEYATLRQQLYDRYRERRDRLAGLQEAVSRGAAKVQERKRELDAEVAQVAIQREEDATRQAEVSARADELKRVQLQLQEQQDLLKLHREELHQEWSDRQAQFEAKECRLSEESQDLEKKRVEYQADLVRLDRMTATLDQRQKEIDDRTRALEEQGRRLAQERQEIDAQTRQVEAHRQQLEAEAARIEQQKTETEMAKAELAKRAAAQEGQQVVLTQLRTRLERMREDLRREDQLITEQRARQEESEADLRSRMQELQRQRAEFADDQRRRMEETRQSEERRTMLEADMVRVRQLQDKLAVDEEQLGLHKTALDAREAEVTEEAVLLKARSLQIMETQERLASERQALRQREADLSQTELAREALQEQLRRRSEELAERQRLLAEKDRQQAEAVSALELKRAELDHERHAAEERLVTLEQDLQRRLTETAQFDQAISQREEFLQQNIERLKQSGRVIGQARKQLREERLAYEAEKQQGEVAAAQRLVEFDALRKEAAGLQQQLSQWAGHTQAAAEHLMRARDQLRGHLAELHAYARQAREDLEGGRSQVQAEADKLQLQGLALLRSKDDHRLAVAAFRQQLIEWQGQVGEMKQSLGQNETRLEQRRAEVDAASVRLARQAEQLEAQEREVTERRDEMERHLSEMQGWYRRKLRELTERFFADTVVAEKSEDKPTPAIQDAANTGVETSGILALTGDVDPGDRKLGDLLQSLQLVDPDTLSVLLVEARKQRQSLRQVLLASGYVTLYQLALIEAGNLDGLMLGPVRVMDRLSVSARETVYRVFDPRLAHDAAGAGDGYAVLRHLAEAEMADAFHLDEFRQRFLAASKVRHPNLAAMLEVLEIQNRPAVLQEWITGLAATDWPALFSVAGVWYRLLGQVALGLHAVHQAGLVHGHLHPSRLILNAGGTLKICGLGEPRWLAQPGTLAAHPGSAPVEPGTADDLAALGRIAIDWANGPAGRPKAGKGKGRPRAVEAILQRLNVDDGTKRYSSAADLLEDLDRVSDDVPANPEAWARLLRHVRDNGQEEKVVRQSA